jgi:hypothetical protein
MKKYIKQLDILTSSGIKQLLKSPAHYKNWIEQEDFDSNALKFGRAFHALMLEPKVFQDDFVKLPEFGDLRTKIAKEAKEAFLKDNQNKNYINSEDYELLFQLRKACLDHPIAKRLLEEQGKNEIAVNWEADGVKHRCTPDRVLSNGVIIDLKTTESAHRDDFSYSVSKYRYDLQAALYLEGTGCREFVFLAIEKTAPFGIGIFKLSNDRLEKARVQIESARAVFKTCLENNVWPSYPNDLQEI